MNVIELLKEHQIAANDFQAAAIANGLKLYHLDTADAMIERAKLYRKWRSKTDKKDMIPTYQAYDLAIAGIDPADVEVRQVDMFAEPS
jgi:hypothetical protein